MNRQPSSDEGSTAPLVPATILPVQFFSGLRHQTRLDGERRLMIAILEDAVHCFQKREHASDPRNRRLFEDAEAWIMADDRAWFFSFENVCEALDLDPSYLREGLRARKGAALHGVPVRRGERADLRKESGA